MKHHPLLSFIYLFIIFSMSSSAYAALQAGDFPANFGVNYFTIRMDDASPDIDPDPKKGVYIDNESNGAYVGVTLAVQHPKHWSFVLDQIRFYLSDLTLTVWPHDCPPRGIVPKRNGPIVGSYLEMSNKNKKIPFYDAQGNLAGEISDFYMKLKLRSQDRYFCEDSFRLFTPFIPETGQGHIKYTYTNHPDLPMERDVSVNYLELRAPRLFISQPPIADAGKDKTVVVGQPINISGINSYHPDWDLDHPSPLNYTWTLTAPDGSDATSSLSNSQSMEPHFVPLMPGTYTATLVVDDGVQESFPSSITLDSEAEVVTLTFSLIPPVLHGAKDNFPVELQDPNLCVNAPCTVSFTFDPNLKNVSDAPRIDTSVYPWPYVPNGKTFMGRRGANCTTINLNGFKVSYGHAIWGIGKSAWARVRGLGNSVHVISSNIDYDTDEIHNYASPGWQVKIPYEGGTVYSAHASIFGMTELMYPEIPSDTFMFTNEDGGWRTIVRLRGAAGSAAGIGHDWYADVDWRHVRLLDVTKGPATRCGGESTNTAPIANAGVDQSQPVGVTILLNGTESSDPDGDSLSYHWTLTRPDNSDGTADLSSNSSSTPLLVLSQKGDYTATLIVNDGDLDSVADTVIIHSTNGIPTANAGVDQTLHVGEAVTLDGSGSSDPDGHALKYQWQLLASDDTDVSHLLSSTITQKPSFSAIELGVYTATLVVSDSYDSSVQDQVIITTTNTPPVAKAGADQNMHVGNSVALDGEGSFDADGDTLSYLWTLTAPDGGNASSLLSDQNATTPSFIPNQVGSYIAKLTVNDGYNSSNDEATISSLNTPPVANAGSDQTLHIGTLATLDGSASTDADGDPISYSWSLLAPDGSNATALLSGTKEVSPSFTLNQLGSYTASLTVSDGYAANTMQTIVNSTNTIPVADPGGNIISFLGDTITLDGSGSGSGSSDADGDSITYEWVVNTAPAGSISMLQNASAATPTITPDFIGDYSIELTVNDGYEDSLPQALLITILTKEDFVIEIIKDELIPFIDSIPIEDFGNKNHGKTFINKLYGIIADINSGNTAQVLDQIQNDLIRKVDGCALNGSPDGKGSGKDWIIKCESQQPVYDLLVRIIAILNQA